MTPASAMPLVSSAISSISLVSVRSWPSSVVNFSPSLRAADDDGRAVARARRLWPMQMIIERVQRLADFQHHVIRHVHHVVDAADADLLQRRAQPVRAGTDLHAFARRARCNADKAPASSMRTATRRPAIGSDSVLENLNDRQLERISRHRRDFARDADDAVQVRPVRRDFQIVHHVAAAAAEIFGERLADLRVRAAGSAGRPPDRAGRVPAANTSCPGLDAEDFPFLDDERLLLARLQRQREVRQDERHLVAGLVILRAANDRALARAVIDPADRKLVRSRVLCRA